jgi:hypothetical protein
MVELLRTGDVVMLGWLRNRLREAGIETHVFDAHTSSLYGGALDLGLWRFLCSFALSSVRR